MQIIANGEKLKVRAGVSLERILELLEEFPQPDMLVSVNKVIIHPKEYGTAILRENDRVETIYIGFGG